MRKLTSTFFMSLNGVVDAPQDWHFPYMTPEMMEVVGSSLAGTDSLLLGRVTYQEWAAFWPHQASDGGMADFLNGTQKYVASTTLDSVEWSKSTLLSGDLATAVSELKAQPGGDIVTNGSGTLVRSLLQERLVDEVRVLVHPVVVGAGRHLFESGIASVGLELAGMNQLPAGVLDLTYRLST